MGGILVKCSGGAGGVEGQGAKASPAGWLPQGVWGVMGLYRGRKKKALLSKAFLNFWCPEGDSNSHSFRKRILNPPRLPIPPSGQWPRSIEMR